MSTDSASEDEEILQSTESDSSVEDTSSMEDMPRVEAIARAGFYTQKHPVDHVLEQILDQACNLNEKERSKIPRTPDGYLMSTPNYARRRIFRFWPRHPEGTIYRGAPAWKCKQAPNATHLWGATLFDFYHTYRVPSIEGMVTKTTGNRMAAWCKMVGETDTAKYELKGAEMEDDPRRLEAADIVEIHENQVDFRLPDTRYGREVIAAAKERGHKDNDIENRRKPFHPSSYPPPFPVPPFNCPAPRLETTIPLHLLPQKLIVHDPYNTLHAERDSDASKEKPERSTETVDGKIWVDPWPFDCSDPTQTPSYQTHTYELQLTRKSLDEVARTRNELLASRSDEPECLCYIYPSKDEGPTDTPLIRITVPARPPKPVQTDEAHLFLSKHRRKGEGNHSLVYEAEWEIPRELFIDPKICYACVEEKAKQVWVGQKNSESGVKQNSHFESVGVVGDLDKLRDALTNPGDDVVLPEMDDTELEAHLAELEAQLGPAQISSTAPVSSPLTPASVAQDYLDPKLASIKNCSLPLQACKTWERSTTSTHPAKSPNCGTIWIEALRIPAPPAVTLHLCDADEAAKESRQKVKEARDRGEKTEWVYSEDVTERMKEIFEEDRRNATGRVEELRKRWEDEERQSSAMDVDDDTKTTAKKERTIEAPMNPVGDRCRVSIVYAGLVRTIHVSSVPWVLPGDPPCPTHGRKYLFTPSLDPHKPAPSGPLMNIPAVFGAEQRLPPTMKVGITAKISIPGDGHLSREAINYEKFPRSFAEHWSGYNLCYPLHDPTPCGAITPAFYGFYKKVVRQEKARESHGEVFVEGTVDDKEEGGKEKETYFSPLLLLEDCGDPIDPDSLNLDDRHECSALLFRFHHHGWTHGSFFPRNILMRLGDHADYPMEKSQEDKRFRLIDFGRSRYLEDLAADDEKGRDEWDVMRFDEKSMVCRTMKLPEFT